MTMNSINIPEIFASHVQIRDIQELEKKLNAIHKGGLEKLQIITDYDLTITKHHVNGTRTLSSFEVLRLCENLPDEFLNESKILKEKYFPIEMNPNISRSDKMPIMMEWYGLSERLFDGIVIHPGQLEEVVKKSLPELRDGSLEMFKMLSDNAVPVLVLSAGLGDVIKAVLTNHGIHEAENFHIVSNFFKMQDGVIRGYGCHENGQFIHPFNKNGLGCAEYFKSFAGKENVIVMGDSIGDSNMDDGVPEVKNVLKIGFLYGTKEHIENCLPNYLLHFDIVLIDDQTMKVPQSILQFLST